MIFWVITYSRFLMRHNVVMKDSAKRNNERLITAQYFVVCFLQKLLIETVSENLSVGTIAFHIEHAIQNYSKNYHIFLSLSKTREEFNLPRTQIRTRPLCNQHCSSKYFRRLAHHHYEVSELLYHFHGCTTNCNICWCWISCFVCKWTKSKNEIHHAGSMITHNLSIQCIMIWNSPRQPLHRRQ